ncbi:MAG: dephospho-CoA kinase [Candidatus Omnitrophota bacterium]
MKAAARGRRKIAGRTVIGITGALASGKTAVTDMFVSRGAARIDADEIAHRLLRENDMVKRKVISVFGEGIVEEGEISRRKLAAAVFPDKKKLEALCAILHPGIIREIKEKADHAAEAVIAVDAPLLIESGMHDYVDIVVVVTADSDVLLKRATNRGISEREARDIIEAQMPLTEKIKFADYIIDNSDGRDKIKEGVDRIWEET